MSGFPSVYIPIARGKEPADIVFRNAEIFDSFSCTWEKNDVAVKDGIIVGIGSSYVGKRERDLSGLFLVPGLIDSHVHIESSLLVPREYARLVSTHGTTTVIADPHEIVNVAGIQGIEFMLANRSYAPVDILYMLPSCVPATPLDVGGATLTAEDLFKLCGNEGVLGLGEMMNVPGVLSGDTEVLKKLSLVAIRDGHAPLLSGPDLNAYILAGPDSDHECTTRSEAEEKLRRGMFIFLREGSTERNITDLVSVVTPYNVSRFCFCTDDCHADLLFRDGHIDRCIRTAIQCGLKPELAIRMATLSAADRFGLTDRGAIAPGRRADFCIVDDPKTFMVQETFSLGKPVSQYTCQQSVPALPISIHCHPPTLDQIRLSGTGPARVIGIQPGQITTKSLTFDIDESGIPDINRDLLKIVVCNRYGMNRVGIGLVHGFGLKKGAIAASVSHDAHNIIATGVTDKEILTAIETVIRSNGGMVAVTGNISFILPLDCGGLMSTLPFPEVVNKLDNLHEETAAMCGIADPFMYLSFLALTVIPELRLTDRGLFDGIVFKDVPLFH